MSQGGTLGCWGGALLNPAMLGSFWAMELGVAAGGTALAVPWCRVFRGRTAPAVFARGVYCKSLSGCLRAITRRQVSAWGRCQRGAASFGSGERVMLSAGLPPTHDAPAPYGVSYWETHRPIPMGLARHGAEGSTWG